MKSDELTKEELRALRDLINERIEWMDAHSGLALTHDNYQGLKTFWRTIRGKLK